MTPFKTILLRLGREQRLKRQLAVGMELANRFGAHLIGLAVLPDAVVVPDPRNPGGESVANGRYRAAMREEIGRMQRAFAQAVRGQGFSSEWLVEDQAEATPPCPTASGYPVDLIVAGPVEDCGSGGACSSATEQLVFQSGRPVLVLPKAVSGSAVGGRILVAWNGSREATKAAFDALPLLQTARHVTVLTIGDEMQGNGHGRLAAESLCAALVRHDVIAEAETIALPGADIGPALLSAVKAEGADMLVMGCIGYPLKYDFTLGDASRHVLRETPVPVLMAH